MTSRELFGPKYIGSSKALVGECKYYVMNIERIFNSVAGLDWTQLNKSDSGIFTSCVNFFLLSQDSFHRTVIYN